MTLDLDTFLVAVYYFVDDVYQRHLAPLKPPRPGPDPEMADSEVITLAILEQWDLHRSETGMLDYARKHWRSYFPRLLTQSSFNKRVRDLAGVMCAMTGPLAERLARWLSLSPAYEVIDGVAVPIMRCCRGDAKRLFAMEAAVGTGGPDRRFYYGFKIVSMVNAAGLITGFVLGPANTEERFLAEALFRSRTYPGAPAPTAAELDPVLGEFRPKKKRRGMRTSRIGPTGPLNTSGAGQHHGLPCLGDLGFMGKKWKPHWRLQYGVDVLTSDDYKKLPEEERKRYRKWLSGLRQKVETTFYWLQNEFGLRFSKARSFWGFIARMGAKMLAFNLAIGINYGTGRPAYSLPGLNPMMALG